ncbi:phage tail protein [Pantoea sp. ICBG 1758]|uniref:phage tail assembly chaperone family protein, TAC n=1 Tax=Pantoea sp. ICBG 1758 TaxID=2071682 RepID=UPI000CE55471|nr:phage tail assembly chaperone family protein, TAC [Pantoea sp. ICBG 1758]PPC63924.1 phage tail protein [Pantoea sp. ICBG 1758]
MKLTLENLENLGAFTGRPVEREIEWQQGKDTFQATVFIRPMGYQAATSDIMAIGGKIDGIAGRIAASVCDEEGKPVFTVADITGEANPDRGPLDGALTVALLVAIQEVNDLGKATSSPKKTNSGVS